MGSHVKLNVFIPLQGDDIWNRSLQPLMTLFRHQEVLSCHLLSSCNVYQHHLNDFQVSARTPVPRGFPPGRVKGLGRSKNQSKKERFETIKRNELVQHLVYRST